MNAIVDPIFAGPTRLMPATGKPTGMFKTAHRERMRFGVDGIEGDGVGDRRVHGGPEKAVHQFPVEHYEWLSARYPERAADFVAGAVGENFSTHGMDEFNVCIGDVLALGSVRLQVSQSRSPCVKLEQRFDLDDLATAIHHAGRAGWYYRVLEPGVAQAGDALMLIDRNPDPVSLREVWELNWSHRPALPVMERIIATPGLSPAIKARLMQRAHWLRTHAG